MTKGSTNQLAIGKYAIFFLNSDFKIYLLKKQFKIHN